MGLLRNDGDPAGAPHDHHKSIVAAYSLRARERPTVSMPVTWEELERATARADADALVFGPADTSARLEAHGDLFEPVLSLVQRLPR